jgi:hypothetical protein
MKKFCDRSAAPGVFAAGKYPSTFRAIGDAQLGHTGAGGVNLALKSGTNTLHGERDRLSRAFLDHWLSDPV